jgi:uncharacterized protein RhaS with RHS repeats
MNFHNRQYDPQIGRFLGVDPLAAATASMSSYTGMNNNPASVVDPLGLMGIGIISWVGYAPTRMDQMLMMSPSVSMDQLGITDDLRNYNEKIVAAAKAREQARETKQHASTQTWTGESPFSSGSSVCNLFPTEVPSANEVYGVGGGTSDGGDPDPQSGGGGKKDEYTHVVSSLFAEGNNKGAFSYSTKDGKGAVVLDVNGTLVMYEIGSDGKKMNPTIISPDIPVLAKDWEEGSWYERVPNIAINISLPSAIYKSYYW